MEKEARRIELKNWIKRIDYADLNIYNGIGEIRT